MLNPQENTIARLLERLKLKSVTIPKVGRDAEKPEPSYTAGRKGKWYIALENSMTVFLKVKIHLPYDPAIPVLGIYPKELKAYVHTEIYTDLCMNDHCSFICSNQKLEI